MPSFAWWPRSGSLRVLLTSLVIVSLMILSRHYLPSDHESAEGVVAHYAPDLSWGRLTLSTHEESSDDEERFDEDANDEQRFDENETAEYEEAYAEDGEEGEAPGEPEETSADEMATKQPAIRTCAVTPSADDYIISMKTGATEVFAKLPEQLLTTLRCIPKYMIFSDLEQDMGEHHIYGALEDVSDKYKYSHRDFAFYRRLLDLAAKGQDLSLLANMKLEDKEAHSAWNLDKWKFVPIAHKVFKEHPDAKWYMFLEADSYMAWPNVMELLAQYESEEPWYLGAPHFYGDLAFAQGGMGYFVSHRAMRMFNDIYDHKHIAHWEKETSENPFGDAQIAAALRDAGTNLTGVPGLFGETPSSFEWHAGRWCEPALSWHHMHSHDLEAMSQFESRSLEEDRSTYTYGKMFGTFVEPHLAATRYDWDNLGRDRIYTGSSGVHGDEDRRYKQEVTWIDLDDNERKDIWKDLDDEQKERINDTGKHVKDNRWDELSKEEMKAAWDDLSAVEKQAHLSASECRKACEEWNDCLQYYHMTGRCHLHRSVRLGHYVEDWSATMEDDSDTPSAGNRTVSGWFMDRVREMKDKAESCGSVSEWLAEHTEKDRP